MRRFLAWIVLLIVLSSSALTFAAGPTVTIDSPLAAAVVADSFPISGTLQSTYTVSTVQAQIQGSAQNLAFSTTGYNGTVDASAVAVGPMLLTVTATDSLNTAGSASVSLIHDHPPTLSVGTPNGVVARPDVRLSATCTDPDMYGCASLSVSIGSTVIASTTTATLDTMVSLSQYDRHAVTLTFAATDTQGLTTTLARAGYVDTNATLTEVARGDGPILDFDATRVLFTTDTSLVIRSRGGADTVIGAGVPTANTIVQRFAYLTSHGAIWAGAPSSGGVAPTAGGEWRDGVALTNTASYGQFAANGDYAVWCSSSPNGLNIFWRTIASDTTTQILSGGIDGPCSPDIASNGDAVFTVRDPTQPATLPQRIGWYRGGVLSGPAASCFRCDIARTDGVNVVYRQVFAAGETGNSYLYTAGGELVLDSSPRSAASPLPEYAVAGGWTAFTRISNSTQMNLVYTRSPSGAIAQASVLNAGTNLDALADTGDVVYNASGTRYLGRAGGGTPATFADNANGRVVYLGGAWFVVLGQLLLQYGGSALGGDAGAGGAGPDASGSDGSTSDAALVDASVADASSEDASTPDAAAQDAIAAFDGGGGADEGGGVNGSDAATKPPAVSAGNGGGCSTSPARGDGALRVVLALGIAGLGVARRRRRRVPGDHGPHVAVFERSP